MDGLQNFAYGAGQNFLPKNWYTQQPIWSVYDPRSREELGRVFAPTPAAAIEAIRECLCCPRSRPLKASNKLSLGFGD